MIEKEDVIADLAEIIKGMKFGRNHSNEITLFKSVGNAIQDLAMVNLILKKINYDCDKKT